MPSRLVSQQSGCCCCCFLKVTVTSVRSGRRRCLWGGRAAPEGGGSFSLPFPVTLGRTEWPRHPAGTSTILSPRLCRWLQCVRMGMGQGAPHCCHFLLHSCPAVPQGGCVMLSDEALGFWGQKLHKQLYKRTAPPVALCSWIRAGLVPPTATSATPSYGVLWRMDCVHGVVKARVIQMPPDWGSSNLGLRTRVPDLIFIYRKLSNCLLTIKHWTIYIIICWCHVSRGEVFPDL